MKLISWNVEGSQPGVAEQAAELLRDPVPDLVALQEVRGDTVEDWKRELAAKGFRESDIVTTQRLVGDRTNFLLTASKYPVVKPESRRPPSRAFEVPFFELVLATIVRVDGRNLEIVNTHVPNGSSNGYRKIEHFEGLYRYLARTWSPNGRPRILCGDFNSPRREDPDGTVLTWAQRKNGKLRPRLGQRWDAGERCVILGLKAFDLADVYREKYGYSAEPNPISWAVKRPKLSTSTSEDHDREFGRRYDHIYASAQLRLDDCGYLEDWRTGESPLSDHAAVWADFKGL